MNNVFELINKTGRLIYLSNERLKHIVKNHPDMSDQIEEIKVTLTMPTLITAHKYDNIMRNYYRYQKETRDYLLVVGYV